MADQPCEEFSCDRCGIYHQLEQTTSCVSVESQHRALPRCIGRARVGRMRGLHSLRVPPSWAGRRNVCIGLKTFFTNLRVFHRASKQDGSCSKGHSAWGWSHSSGSFFILSLIYSSGVSLKNSVLTRELTRQPHFPKLMKEMRKKFPLTTLSVLGVQ